MEKHCGWVIKWFKVTLQPASYSAFQHKKATNNNCDTERICGLDLNLWCWKFTLSHWHDNKAKTSTEIREMCCWNCHLVLNSSIKSIVILVVFRWNPNFSFGRKVRSFEQKRINECVNMNEWATVVFFSISIRKYQYVSEERLCLKVLIKLQK